MASTSQQDTLSSFSSRGPRAGDYGLKPDIAAPGQDITAARAPGVFPQFAVDKNYVTLSGTSMATPHVAGAAAILAGEHPTWTGEQIKAALTGSAADLPRIDVFGDGAGRLNVARASTQSVRALTAGISMGRLSWPQDPSKPTARQVTYANDGGSAVTLSLALDVATRGGVRAPFGLFTTDPTVTVPPHGTATVTVNVAAGPDRAGAYEGRLLATTGDNRVVTPLAVQILGSTHTVTFTARDRAGRPATADNIFAALQNDATGTSYGATPNPDGTLSATVPDGIYPVLGLVSETGRTFASDTTTDLALGNRRIAADTEITLDATAGQPATVSLDDPTARPDTTSAFFTLASQVDGTDGPDGILIASNARHQYIDSPASITGVSYSYSAAWAPPQDSIVTSGERPYEVGDVVDTTTAGWSGDVTGPLKDIGEPTDPTQIGDVADAVVLVAPDVTTPPDTDPPTQDQFRALMAALKAGGAKLVIAYDYIEDTSILPVLQTFSPVDVQGLRDSVANGPVHVHVTGRPASPSLYLLHKSVGSAVPSGVTWHFQRSELSREDATYRTPGEAHLDDQIFPWTDPASGLSGAVDHELVFPQTRTEYFTPGITWTALTDVGINSDWSVLSTELTAPTVRHVGQNTTSSWGSAPFGPRLPAALTSREDNAPLPWAYRQGDKIVTAIPMFNEADQNHYNTPDGSQVTGQLVDTGTTVLTHHGQPVDDSDVPGTAGFTLPAAPGTYQLRVQATRPAPLSPRVGSVWTFTTAHTDPTRRSPLDMLDAGFTLALDGSDSAPAAGTLNGTVTVRHQPGSTGPNVSALAVAVSYDDGHHWNRATVQPTATGQWKVSIPAGGSPGGFASLRLTASDMSGNALHEVITRAYALH